MSTGPDRRDLPSVRQSWNLAARSDVLYRQFVFQSGPGERHSPGSRTEDRTGAILRPLVSSAAMERPCLEGGGCLMCGECFMGS